MRLNKKKIHELRMMLLSARSWHTTYNMQDYQDLEPIQYKRGREQAKRWQKANDYFEKIIKELEENEKSKKRS